MDQLAVGVGVHLGVDTLARQELRISRLLHRDAASHLANDEFDVLVVDRHALVSVYLLDLFDQVALRFTHTLDVHEFLGVTWTFNNRVTSGDLVTVVDLETGQRWNRIDVFGAVVADDQDRAALTVVFAHSNNT